MPDIQFFNHIDMQGNEVRNASVHKLAAHPAGANLYAGRMWELTSNGGLYYSPDGIAIVQLLTAAEVESRSRFVGALDLSSGTISLITPVADSLNGETTWDAGDKGIVTVAGVLVPAPAGGNAAVQAGDIVMSLVDNPASNSDFVVIQSNLPANLPTVNAPLTVVPGDWIGAPGAWVATKALDGAADQAIAYSIRDAGTNEVVQFGVVLGIGSISLQASTPAAPASTFNMEIVKR